MYYYKSIIQYDGSNYFGWQIQSGSKHKTVQGEFNRALARVVKSQDIKTIASGRTDAGVHAIGQVVKIIIPNSISVEGLKKGMNSRLPADILILSLELTDYDFHPVFSAVSKIYDYYFTINEDIPPFYNHFLARYRYELDCDAMRAGCNLFVGEHNFKNFMCTGTLVKSTVREILNCELFLESFSVGPVKAVDVFHIRVEGTGFLKQMVRQMVGALWEIGRGKKNLDDLQDALANTPSLIRVGPTAPAEGLYLLSVKYNS